jgi:hypothetical protein
MPITGSVAISGVSLRPINDMQLDDPLGWRSSQIASSSGFVPAVVVTMSHHATIAHHDEDQLRQTTK